MTVRCTTCGASAPISPGSEQDIRDGVISIKTCEHGPAELVEATVGSAR